jgi:hypothetical protein
MKLRKRGRKRRRKRSYNEKVMPKTSRHRSCRRNTEPGCRSYPEATVSYGRGVVYGGVQREKTVTAIL